MQPQALQQQQFLASGWTSPQERVQRNKLVAWLVSGGGTQRQSAIDTDETDDMLEESHEPEAAPRGESVLESFSMSGPRKPKALSIDAVAVKRPRGRPRKVK